MRFYLISLGKLASTVTGKDRNNSEPLVKQFLMQHQCQFIWKLFVLLKMGNISDLNDLYNVQDIISLMVIMENRFQEMPNKTGYNPRKINLVSKLSS